MSEDIQNSEAVPVEDSGTASVSALLSGSLDEGNGTAAGASEQIEAALLELASHARTDVVAERWVGRDRSGYKPGSGPISQAAIRAHLSNRGPHLGLYVMPPGDTTRLAAFDLDDHEGTTGWDLIAATARKKDWGLPRRPGLPSAVFSLWRRQGDSYFPAVEGTATGEGGALPHDLHAGLSRLAGWRWRGGQE